VVAAEAGEEQPAVMAAEALDTAAAGKPVVDTAVVGTAVVDTAVADTAAADRPAADRQVAEAADKEAEDIEDIAPGVDKADTVVGAQASLPVWAPADTPVAAAAAEAVAPWRPLP